MARTNKVLGKVSKWAARMHLSTNEDNGLVHSEGILGTKLTSKSEWSAPSRTHDAFKHARSELPTRDQTQAADRAQWVLRRDHVANWIYSSANEAAHGLLREV